MLKSLLRRFSAGPPAPDAAQIDPSVVGSLVLAAGSEFDLRRACALHDGLPHPDWDLVRRWIGSLPDAEQSLAWTDCKRAWLCVLADCLGEDYRLVESAQAFVLSRQPANEARATLDYVGDAQRRVRRILEDVARKDPGKEVLLLFPDADQYYRYVAAYYPEDGEFPMSAGVYLHAGCGHFVTHGDEMWRFEPTIVHEMTHSLVSHLPIPAWLNEGMAVNSEQRLSAVGGDIWSVVELEAKHRRFWTTATIQEFWSGAAYKRTDEGCELAYDLGRILVNGMCAEWSAFKRFVTHAHVDDGGIAAAREHMDLDLGEFVRHFLEAPPGEWGPTPHTWTLAPERGAFAARE